MWWYERENQMFKRFKQVNNKSNILIQSKNDIIILYEMLKEENSGNRAKKKKKKKKKYVGVIVKYQQSRFIKEQEASGLLSTL